MASGGRFINKSRLQSLQNRFVAGLKPSSTGDFFVDLGIANDTVRQILQVMTSQEGDDIPGTDEERKADMVFALISVNTSVLEKKLEWLYLAIALAIENENIINNSSTTRTTTANVCSNQLLSRIFMDMNMGIDFLYYIGKEQCSIEILDKIWKWVSSNINNVDDDDDDDESDGGGDTYRKTYLLAKIKIQHRITEKQKATLALQNVGSLLSFSSTQKIVLGTLFVLAVGSFVTVASSSEEIVFSPRPDDRPSSDVFPGYQGRWERSLFIEKHPDSFVKTRLDGGQMCYLFLKDIYEGIIRCYLPADEIGFGSVRNNSIPFTALEVIKGLVMRMYGTGLGIPKSIQLSRRNFNPSQT